MEDFWEKTGNILVRPRAAPQEAPLPNYEQDGTAGRLEQAGIVKDYEGIRRWGDARGWDNKTPDVLCKTFYGGEQVPTRTRGSSSGQEDDLRR